MKELKRDTEKEREQDGLEVYRREGKREGGGGGERERGRELLREGAAQCKLGKETDVVNLIKNLRVRSSLLLSASKWHSDSSLNNAAGLDRASLVLIQERWYLK